MSLTLVKHVQYCSIISVCSWNQLKSIKKKSFYNKIFKLFKIKTDLVTLISLHFDCNVETNFAEYSYIYRFPTK